jgi:MFS family permease
MIMASMFGNYLYQFLVGAQNSKIQSDSVLQGVFMASSCLFFFGGSAVNTPWFAFILALLIQVAIGFYWPSIGLLRAEIVPPELRLQTLSLNKLLTAIVTLLSLHYIVIHRSSFALLSICAILNGVALYAHHKLMASAAIEMAENENNDTDPDL